MRDSVWNRNFTLLWQGKFVSSLGSYATTIALGFFVLLLTDSAKIMSWVLAAEEFSFLFFILLGGYVADVFSRKKILVIADFVRGISVLVLAYLVFSNRANIWFLFLMVIILGAGRGFFRPASKALISDFVSKKFLRKANSFFYISENVGGILGNSFGGFLFQFFGAPLLFLFDGISYILSAFSELFIKLKSKSTSKTVSKPHIFKDIKDGLIYVKSNKGLFNLIAFAGLSNFFNMFTFVLWMPLFNQEFSPFLYGLMGSSLAIGIVLGALINGLFNFKNKYAVFIWGVFIWPLLFAFAALFTNFIWLAFFVFLAGLVNGFTNVFFSASIQAGVKKHYLGKVLSVSSFVIYVAMPFGMLFGGFMSDFFSFRLLIFAAYFLSALSILPFMSPELKRLINFKE